MADKQPALLAIHVARKPLEGTVAQNALKYGTGSLNIDETRIGYEAGGDSSSNPMVRIARGCKNTGNPNGLVTVFNGGGNYERGDPKGRWPANVILQHLPECRQVGSKKIKPVGATPVHKGQSKGGMFFGEGANHPGHISFRDADGKETVDAWICVEGCPVADLDRQSGNRPVSGSARLGAASTYNPEGTEGGMFGVSGGSPSSWPNDSGGASRYFKQVQAPLSKEDD